MNINDLLNLGAKVLTPAAKQAIGTFAVSALQNLERIAKAAERVADVAEANKEIVAGKERYGPHTTPPRIDDFPPAHG